MTKKSANYLERHRYLAADLTMAIQRLTHWTEKGHTLNNMVQKIRQRQRGISTTDVSLGEHEKSRLNTDLRTIIRLWCEFLKVDAPDPEQNFFAFGDSIQAIKFVEQVNLEINRALPLANLYKYPTLEKWLKLLS